MPLYCPICMETLFTYTIENIPDIYATPCGHVFHAFCLENWFETKENCPQCRKTVVSKLCTKLFLEVSNSSSTESDDILTLKAQIETIKFDLKLAATNTAKKEEHLKKGLAQISKMRKRIVDKEQEVDKIKSQLLAVQEQNRVLHQKLVDSKGLVQEIDQLKGHLNRYMWIEDMINSPSLSESSEYVNNVNLEDCKKLFVYFKRALREERQERESAENARISLSQENLKLKKQLSSVESELNLLNEVVKAYKQKLEEPSRRSSLPLDTSLSHTPGSSDSKSKGSFSETTSSTTIDLAGDDSDPGSSFEPSTNFKRNMFQLSKTSPALAKKFKVVSKRRKFL